MVDLPNGKTVATYTGAEATYSITTAGILVFKAWGGPGSGSSIVDTRLQSPGGAGGFVAGKIDVVPGDVIKVEVGQGGRNPANFDTRGTPGWPDGGPGGFQSGIRLAGQGGGSSRIYLNNVLIAVAGGGGGSCPYESAPGARGAAGAAGGAVGSDGDSGGAGRGTGGTQSAGGVCTVRPTDTVSSGGYLRGGSGGSTTVDVTISNATGNVGAGGGGGYYGGGGSWGLASNNSSGAGGGSSYLAPVVSSPRNLGGTGPTPAETTDPDYVAGTAVGGASAGPSVAPSPGHGLVVLKFAQPLSLGTPTTKAFSGTTETLIVAEDGVIEANIWGAGGGGGIALTNLTQRAGGGGYTKTYIPVVAGDQIDVMVGGGGQKVADLTTQANGGWPDGGKGARGAGSGAESYAGGGGGGSTRIYLNGTLVTVAGGGGGGSRGWGGAGGGLTAGQGYGGAAGDALIGGFGGTQAAGGLGDPNNASTDGSSLQGGNSIMNTANGGGGGGGGYYGGGASRGIVSSGGGGSSYRHAAMTASTFSIIRAGEATGVPPGTALAIYPGANVGYGGNSGRSSAANNEPGYPGAAVLTLQPADHLGTLPVQFAATGADHEFTATESGIYSFSLWGGGGGGGRAALDTTPYPPGGAGGFTTADFPVGVGDIIKIQVGKGGLAARATNTAGGGWPDGGNGGSNGANVYGSGGGSTRVWKNGVLMAVAGAGGGSGGLWHRGDAGPGGGTLGGDAYDRTLVGVPATGGTQSAGGYNVISPTDANKTGGYLQGGHGYPAGGSPTTTTDQASGAGGGGYYGGGGGGRTGSYSQGGGGGSGYVNTAAGASGTTTRTTYTTAADGARGIPPETTNPLYPVGSGVAYGGASHATNTSITNGGDGYAAYSILDAAIGEPTPDLVVTPPAGSAFNAGSELQLGYNPANQPYEIEVGQSGTLICRLWAGGGGGGFNTKGDAKNGAGASGGFVRAYVAVSAGDVVKVEVGQGGRGAGASPAGGWPDGGAGVSSGCSGSDCYNGGGGGGSTRLYVNNVLQLIAGAAGGGWGPFSTTPDQVRAGGGGGLTGGAGYNRSGVLTNGGTQTAGGVNPAGDGPGGYLQGGTQGGGGGGGGYYGGASGNPGGGTTFLAGGGGGSSFADGVRVSNVLHEQGLWDAGNPGGYADTRYPGNNVGRGGLSGAAQPSPAGGDGYALIQLSDGAPANPVASFDVTVTSTPPQGSGGVPAAAAGDVTDLAVLAINGFGSVLGSAAVAMPGPVVLNPPLADGSGQHNVLADLVTIGITQQVTGGASVSALVNTDEVLLLTVVGPDATAEGAVDFINTAPFAPLTRVITGPTAQILGYAEGGMPIVAIASPEGNASTGQDILADLVTIAVNPFDGSATVTGTPTGQVSANSIFLSPVFGSVTAALGATGAIGEVFLVSPEGNASQGEMTFGEALPTVAVTTVPEGSAVGPANAIALNNGAGNDNDSRWLVRIVLTPPAATPEASASFTPLVFDQPITVQPVQAIVDLGAFVLAPMPRPLAVSMTGLGYANQQAVIDLPTITLDAPHGYADDSKKGKVHLRRTRVAGKKPLSLEPGELYLNETDGVLYHRDAQGTVAATPLLDIMADAGFGSGTIGQVRNGAGAWVDPDPVFTAPVLLPVQPGTVVLSDAVSRRVNAAPTAARVVYHPFTVNRAFSFSGLSVEVSFAASAFADLGVCEWDDATGPGAVLGRGTVNCSSVGKKTNAVALTLAPGTYAAVIAVSGAGSPVFLAHEAAQKLTHDFVPQGDPSAPASNGYGSDPTAFEPNAIAYVMAEVTA